MFYGHSDPVWGLVKSGSISRFLSASVYSRTWAFSIRNAIHRPCHGFYDLDGLAYGAARMGRYMCGTDWRMLEKLVFGYALHTMYGPISTDGREEPVNSRFLV